MNLRSLLDQRLLEPLPASREEITELARMAERDLRAHEAAGLPPDWQFAIAYGAALSLVTIVVRSAGYRALAGAHHYAVIEAFGAVAGEAYTTRVSFLQTCRAKRNRAEYDRAGEVTLAEVQALVTEANELRRWVAAWLRFHHPDLLPEQWRAEEAQR